MSENILKVLLDVRRARKQGPAVLARRQRARLARMVAFARATSPYYRELYQGLPERISDPRLLLVTDKRKLMARFDDWVTDGAVTIETARPFVENPALFGKRLLDKYLVVTTSGTTGLHGVFLIDQRRLAVSAPLFLSMLRAWLRPRDLIRLIARGGRVGLVFATGTPLATGVGIARIRRLGRRFQAFSVHTPLPDLVRALNTFQPVVLMSYATVTKLLASEQEAGRLHIKPVLLVLTAEGLAPDEYDRIATAFNTKVGNSYAASECPFMSYSCEHGWLHVNSDWVVFEPVDADYRPMPPGVPSHTVLISNLANRVQPILRYDLGDSVLQRPAPCPCGNPLPAIRGQGRAADMLTFPATAGPQIRIPPLLFGASIYHIPGIEQFQLVQTAPTRLRVRLRLAAGAHRIARGRRYRRRSRICSLNTNSVVLPSSALRNRRSRPPAASTGRSSHWADGTKARQQLLQLDCPHVDVGGLRRPFPASWTTDHPVGVVRVGGDPVVPGGLHPTTGGGRAADLEGLCPSALQMPGSIQS